MALRFRALEEQDFPALLDLWAASWAEVYADFTTDRAWFESHVAPKWGRARSVASARMTVSPASC